MNEGQGKMEFGRRMDAREYRELVLGTPPAFTDRFEGIDVQAFARAWQDFPPDVKEALISLRQVEEQTLWGAPSAQLLSDRARGFFRQMGGSAQVREYEAGR